MSSSSVSTPTHQHVHATTASARAAAAAAAAAGTTTHASQPFWSVDQLDGLDASVWSTIAQHGQPINIYSPDIQEVIDVTDGRLRNLYDAFDRYILRRKREGGREESFFRWLSAIWFLQLFTPSLLSYPPFQKQGF